MLQEELQIACQKIKNEMNITEEITIEDEIFNSKKWDAAWTKKCFLENSKKLDYIEKSRSIVVQLSRQKSKTFIMN